MSTPPTTSPPTLSATNVSAEEEEGRCGNFKRVKEWAVAHPVSGVIVQRVTRRFEVTRVGQTGQMTGSALNAYVRGPGSTVNATETEYWELWTVDSSGSVSDGGDDTFGLCSLIPGDETTIPDSTKGRFTMTGTARFYPTTTAAATITGFGFSRRAVASAGGLYSTATNPSARLPTPVGPTINHQVVVNWDSSSSDENDHYGTVTQTLTAS